MKVYDIGRLLLVSLLVLLLCVGCSRFPRPVAAAAFEPEPVPAQALESEPPLAFPVVEPVPVQAKIPLNEVPAAKATDVQEIRYEEQSEKPGGSKGVRKPKVAKRRFLKTNITARSALSPEEIREITDRHAKELKTANYDFHYKKTMKYDKENNEQQEPTLKVSLRRTFDGNVVVSGNEGEIYGKIKVGNIVEASLVSDKFKIDLIYPKDSEGRQVLSVDHDLDWRWSISPKTSGKDLPLHLYIKDIVAIDGEKPIFQTITSLHHVVNVEASGFTIIDELIRAIDKGKDLVLSIKGLIASIIALCSIIIYKKRKKRRTTPP